MHVPLWIWLATVAGILALFLFDFFAHARRPHEPTLREAGLWSTFFIGLAVVFGAGLWWIWGPERGAEYFAGFITEKSLSIDNLFVFVTIMAKFAVPRPNQQKALLLGVAIALLLRGLFIAAGAAAIERFSWVFYIFGVFLIYTAGHLASQFFHKKGNEDGYRPGAGVRFLQKVLPISEGYHGQRLTVRLNDKRLVTPLFIAVAALGFTDVLFALDSIPAIYGLTREAYIVFTTNAFALLGLLQLYFLLGGLLKRLVYLGLGLSAILAFIGVKLVMEALQENALPFINGGQPLHGIPEIHIWVSMAIILAVLLVTTAASLLRSR